MYQKQKAIANIPVASSADSGVWLYYMYTGKMEYTMLL